MRNRCVICNKEECICTIEDIKKGAEKESWDFVHWFIWQDNNIELNNSNWLKKYCQSKFNKVEEILLKKIAKLEDLSKLHDNKITNLKKIILSKNIQLEDFGVDLDTTQNNTGSDENSRRIYNSNRVPVS